MTVSLISEPTGNTGNYCPFMQLLVWYDKIGQRLLLVLVDKGRTPPIIRIIIQVRILVGPVNFLCKELVDMIWHYLVGDGSAHCA